MPATALDEKIALRVIQSSLLRDIPGIRHGITARVNGASREHGNIAYSPPRDQNDAWAMRRAWCAALDLDPDAIVTAGQVHGANAILVDETHIGQGAKPGSGRVGLGDALVTRAVGPVLLTLHADCLPLLLVDPDLPAVASVHAGWRGTVADVAGSAVRRMAQAFGSPPERLLAFLGPTICRDCYEVGSEVARAWDATAGATAARAIEERATAWRLDLQAANRLLLERAGLTATNIDASSICTRCGGDDWFSHRGQGPETGRFGALIAITGSSV